MSGILNTKDIRNFLYFLPYEFYRVQKEQWLSKDRILELQWMRFKRLLKHAYENTEFYHHRFREAGIHPEDIQSRRDLPSIPVTTKEHLKGPNPLIADGYDIKKMKVFTTSGSLGKKTRTFFDTQAWLKGKFLLKLRARLACGLRPWDRIALFTEKAENNSLHKAIILRQRSFCILDEIEAYGPELETYKPTALYGFPSHLSRLAEQGIPVRPSRIFTSSEILDIRARRRIEESFGAEAFDIYGCTEAKEIAWECPQHSGYHINSDWLLVEFVEDRRSPKAAGSAIVVTSLYNYGMPLIRYEVGDRGILLPNDCSCGRGLPLMTPSYGRTVDYFLLPDGSMISPYALTCAMEEVEGIRQYQLRQKKQDLVVVNLVPETWFTKTACELIRIKLKRLLPRVKIVVNVMSNIHSERNGKYRIVASDLRN